MNTTIDLKNRPLYWHDITDSNISSALKEPKKHHHLEIPIHNESYIRMLMGEAHNSSTSSTLGLSANYQLFIDEIYDHPKRFISQIAINPLVAAAAPLFLLLEQIRYLKKTPDTHQLHETLVRELCAFENQAQSSQYRSYIILAARHMICAWADQIILNSAWDKTRAWEKIKLSDSPAEERHHSISLLIVRCLKEPVIYIDLLEFFYLCLSLGFQINHSPHSQESSISKLDETRDDLFEIINKQRGCLSRQLEITNVAEKSLFISFAYSLLKPMLTLITMSVLMSGYFMLNKKLEIPSTEKDTITATQSSAIPATI